VARGSVCANQVTRGKVRILAEFVPDAGLQRRPNSARQVTSLESRTTALLRRTNPKLRDASAGDEVRQTVRPDLVPTQMLARPVNWYPHELPLFAQLTRCLWNEIRIPCVRPL